MLFRSQFEALIVDRETPIGLQYEAKTVSLTNAVGTQYFQSVMAFIDHNTYGDTPYGSTPYGLPGHCAQMGVQFASDVLDFGNSLGVQFEAKIIDILKPLGVQFVGQSVDQQLPIGAQFEGFIDDRENNTGTQFQGQIVDHLDQIGVQFEGQIVDRPSPIGVQFESIQTFNLGLQFTVSLYNTDRLRVLCEFPSRGVASGSGNNAWGNPIATGQTWLASSTQAGDFDVSNLNTDIVEQIWRSADGFITGVNLDCDTEIPQGVFLDTFAILNHNFTTSATVDLIGSNSPTFSPVGTVINLDVRPNNIFHIEPALPLQSFRYWRIAIDDPTNTDQNFLSVGTIVFGSAQIFQGECMIDRVLRRNRHFADSVRTEGFTAVKNDRSLKRSVRLEFRDLDFNKGNFRALDGIFRTARTSQKCLWIPTPSLTDPTFMERFAVFARLAELPEESHNVKGADLDFIDLALDLDEAE